MLNKYGLKMTGIKAAARETNYVHCHFGSYVQIGYDRSTGDVIANYHVSGSDWTEWGRPDVVTVANARCKLTMQDIADAIRDTLDEIAEREAWQPCY